MDVVNEIIDRQADGQGLGKQELNFAVDWLTQFGYLAKKIGETITLQDVLAAIALFQRFYGLPQSLSSDGTVVDETMLRAMYTPRCGCPDIIRPEHTEYQALVAASATNLPSWRKKEVTYSIEGYVSGLSKSDQQSIIKGAWKAWTDVCGIKMRWVQSKQADILISAGSGRRSNFDGPSGTLAWAYLPNGNDGQLTMLFDLAESWIKDPKQRGILMFNVACHEFGHLLGLEHSRKQKALMAPYYNAAIPVPQWDDDIPRARSRYPVTAQLEQHGQQVDLLETFRPEDVVVNIGQRKYRLCESVGSEIA